MQTGMNEGNGGSQKKRIPFTVKKRKEKAIYLYIKLLKAIGGSQTPKIGSSKPRNTTFCSETTTFCSENRA